MIEIKNLTKTFIVGKTEYNVLDNINLKIEDGDVFGIIGLSGGGKSTLVRCINGLEDITSGDIIYEDQYEQLSIKSLKHNSKKLREYRRKVAMIFQDINLFNQLTVLENIEFPLKLVKGYKKDISLLNKYINLVGLEGKENLYPSQLSGGMRQRVAIARAIISKPSCLLCDEATSALDPQTANQILDLLKDLNKRLGLTIVVIAHQMSVIERICNKVAILDEHKIVESGKTFEVFTNPQTKVSHSLIYSNHVITKLHDDKLIKLIFDGNVDEPIIANIIQDCNILVSIVYASSISLENKVYGNIIFRLPYYDCDILKLKTYLNNKNISYEEVSINEFNRNSPSV